MKQRYKIGYLGAGTWGFCLASLLASKGYEVVLWTHKEELLHTLRQTKEHPRLPGFPIPDPVQFTQDLSVATQGVDLIVESVTSRGIRPLFTKLSEQGEIACPIVLTSKGIEQETGLLLPHVLLEVLGEKSRSLISCLSGPSLAEEVIRNMPTSVVSSSYDPSLSVKIAEIFATPFFRVYPNHDLTGVAFGGAMKNIIAIACGISDGLKFGDNTKAALMTRGLHEMRKLAVHQGASPETLNGLAGLGDLCVTCLSALSRNYRFGRGLAEGLSPQAAKERLGMVVEGMYTCVSALQLGKKAEVALPITQAVYSIIYENSNPLAAVEKLLQRTVKVEHL